MELWKGWCGCVGWPRLRLGMHSCAKEDFLCSGLCLRVGAGVGKCLGLGRNGYS